MPSCQDTCAARRGMRVAVVEGSVALVVEEGMLRRRFRLTTGVCREMLSQDDAVQR